VLDARYMAGLFDGEGSIGIYSYYGDKLILRTQFTQNIYPESRLLIKELKTRFGGNATPTRSLSGKWKFNWQLNSHKAAAFIRWIMPYLRFKRKEAEIALKWQNNRPKPSRNPKTGWFNPYPNRKSDHKVVIRLKKLKALR